MKLIKAVLTALAVGIILYAAYNIAKYPELFITTWKYQLQQEVKAGEPMAVEYYERNYIANDIQLFN